MEKILKKLKENENRIFTFIVIGVVVWFFLPDVFFSIVRYVWAMVMFLVYVIPSKGIELLGLPIFILVVILGIVITVIVLAKQDM